MFVMESQSSCDEMSKYFSAIVIPCLNEQHNLTATCRSLGFGAGQHPAADTVLILVDNGSEDATVTVAKAIQHESRSGSVIVAIEPDRGYVPPRHHGIRVAQAVAADRGVPLQDVLILQADADTIYGDCYIEAMGNRARQMGPGVMIDVVAKRMYSLHSQRLTLILAMCQSSRPAPHSCAIADSLDIASP